MFIDGRNGDDVTVLIRCEVFLIGVDPDEDVENWLLLWLPRKQHQHRNMIKVHIRPSIILVIKRIFFWTDVDDVNIVLSFVGDFANEKHKSKFFSSVIEIILYQISFLLNKISTWKIIPLMIQY